MKKSIVMAVVSTLVLGVAGCAPQGEQVNPFNIVAGQAESKGNLFAKEQFEQNSYYDEGFKYHHGVGVIKDHERAVELYNRAISKYKDTRAMNELGVIYMSSEDITRKDPLKGINLLVRSANMGNSTAKMNLGTALLHGFYVDSDPKRAIQMIRASAQQGNTNAQAFLVKLAMNEIDYNRNEYPMIKEDLLFLVEKGYVEFWETASEGSKYRSLWNRFFKYNLRDRSRMLSDLMALESNCLECRDFKLQNVARKLSEVERYRQQAERDDLNAMYMLGRSYLNGDGVTKNASEGARWIVKSADAGYVPAQYALGVLFLEGKGMVVNHAMAYAWFSIAAKSDRGFMEESWAYELRNWMETYIAKSERVVGQEFAKSWKIGSGFYK